MSRLLAVSAACVLICLICAGCGDSGPDLGSVTGQVTMDGKPLPDAVVTFAPEGGGGNSTAVTDANGNYELIFSDRKGALPGKHKVSVTTQSKADQTEYPAEMTSDSADYEKQASGGGDYSAPAAAPKDAIPERYNAKTELVKEVTSGSNVIDLELTSS